MFKHFSESERDTEEMPNPLPNFLSYIDETNHKRFEDKLDTLGRVELRILLKGYTKKVSYFRSTGLEAQKKLHLIPVPFAGVFVCDDPEGNEILRSMENPQHNKGDPWLLQSWP